MNEEKIQEMKKTMDKILEAGAMSKEKETVIKEKENELNEETAIVKAEKLKNEIEKLQSDKEEFDEMTKNALINMKKDILERRKEVQEEYEENLLKMLEKRTILNKKIEKMKERSDTKEKIEKVENSSEKAIKKIEEENEELKNKYDNYINELNELENKTKIYAKELDILEEIDNVTLEEPKLEAEIETEPAQQQQEIKTDSEQQEKQQQETKTDSEQQTEQQDTKTDSEQQKGQQDTKTDSKQQTESEQEIIIPKAHQRQQPAPQQAPNPTSENKKQLKIVFGNNGKITYGDKEYPISTETIKQGLYHNKQNKKIDGYEPLGLSENITKMLEEINTDVPLDCTVLLAINSIEEIPSTERNKLMIDYIGNVLKTQYEYKTATKKDLTETDKKHEKLEKSDIEITYDMENLSKKPPFWKTLFTRHPEGKNLTGEEKEQFVAFANRANRYELGKTIGQYKEEQGLGTKILNLFKKNRKLLPAPENMHTIDMNKNKIEESLKIEHKAATIYDDTLKYHSNKENRDDFLNAIQSKYEDYKEKSNDDDLTKVMVRKELKDLDEKSTENEEIR